MSRVLSHFAIGAIMTTVLIHMLVPTLRYKKTVIVLGGIWGNIPDFHGISVGFEDVFLRLDTTGWANIFWFHRKMDQLENGPGSQRLAILLAVLFVLTVAVTEWDKHREIPL